MEDSDVGTKKQEPLPTPGKFLERIPMAGLYNFLHASEKWEKRTWAVLLLASTAVTLRYFIPCILTFMEFSTAIEVKHATTPDMPFPVIYVGAEPPLNETGLVDMFYALEPYMVNDTRMKYLTRALRRRYPDVLDIRGALYQAMAYAVHVPTIQPWFSPEDVPIYNEILYRVSTTYRSKWIGLTGAYKGSMYRCDQLIVKCALNDVPFSCCENSQSGLIGPHTWHRINTTVALSRAVKNVPVTGQFSLAFKTKIDRMQLLSGKDDIVGLAFGVGGTTPSLFDSPPPIPGGTKTFMKVVGRRRRLMKNCVQKFRYNSEYAERNHPDLKRYAKRKPFAVRLVTVPLYRYWDSMTDPENYSVQKCWIAQLIETVSRICGCVPFYDTMRPNETSICTPAHIYACYTHGFYGDIAVPPASAGDKNQTSPGAAAGNPKSFPDDGNQNVLAQLKNAESIHAVCLPLCDTWHYDVTMTFVSLNDSFQEFRTVVYNEIVITIDPEYRVENDVLKLDLVAFFATIGDGFGLFLGLCGVAILQTAVWSIAAAILAYRTGRIYPERAAGMEHLSRSRTLI